MEENVWNCLDYNYEIQNFNDNFEVTSKITLNSLEFKIHLI